MAHPLRNGLHTAPMKPLFHLPFLLLLPLALSAGAEPALPTLEKISRTATINLGHRESSVPFSYYDGKHQVVDRFQFDRSSGDVHPPASFEPLLERVQFGRR